MTARARTLLWSTLGGAAVGALVARYAERPPHGQHNAAFAWASSLLAGFTPALYISLALWVAFSLYWEVAAASAAPVERRESHASRWVHLTLVSIGQLMVFLSIPGLRTRFLPSSVVTGAIALAIQVLFVSLGVWARRSLGRHWSGAIAATQGQELVRAGPYRALRHPIYTALLGMYACTAIISGEVHALLGFALITVSYWRKVRLEEQHLSSHFGPSYAEYRDATWGALPGLF